MMIHDRWITIYSMIFVCASLVSFLYWMLLYNQQPQIVLLLSLIVSAIYYTNYALNSKADIWPRLFSADLPHHIAYLTWLIFFPHTEFMYYVPLMLSSLGKIYLLINKPSEDAISVAEELILFQSKTETYILGTLFISSLLPTAAKLLEFAVFVIFCKIKYTFYFPAQKAYVELHFALDNLTRRIGGRSVYHVAYMAVSAIGGIGGARATGREIAY